MEKPKVLILLTDTGGGHRSAGVALEKAFNKRFPGKYDVEILDIQRAMGKFPFKYQPEIHNFLSGNRFMEEVFNIFARLSNTKLLYPFMRRAYSWGTVHAAQRIVQERNPVLVVSTHSIISTLIRRMKEGGSNFRYAVVITDLVTLFKGWLDPTADLTIAPTESAIQQALDAGIRQETIKGPLFPINPDLENYQSREKVLASCELDPGKNAAVIMGGGVGITSMLKGIEILSKDSELQLIVVTGGLDKLRKKLEKKYQDHENVCVLGFVSNIQDYLNAADVVVTKPGPASILEAELFDKHAVLTRKVGFQEEGNIGYALENPKFRFIGSRSTKLAPTISELLRHTGKPMQRRAFDESVQIVEELDKLIES